jgi:aspartate racemase
MLQIESARKAFMKTLGLIGGIGPESTIEYYRYIIADYRERQKNDSYPAIIIDSINLTKMVGLVTANQFDRVADYLIGEFEKLARAGADFGALAANTPHIVFDEVQARSSLPLISIVEATCEHVRCLGLKRVALFGTRFTMEGHFYPKVFSRAEIGLVTPNEDERAYIHDKYMNELLKSVFSSETREGLLTIVDRMKQRDGIEAVILGGTELPLILTDDEQNGIPLLNTTQIHVERLVTELLS